MELRGQVRSQMEFGNEKNCALLEELVGEPVLFDMGPGQAELELGVG